MFRIRIPIPVDADLQPWMLGAFVLLLLIVGVAFTAKLWKTWGLAAWAVLAAAALPAALVEFARLAGSGLPPGFAWRSPILAVVGSGLLVWLALFFWGRRRKVDVAGALLVGIVYGLLMPPSTYLADHLRSAAWAALLLTCVAVACRRIEPLARAVFAGLAGGMVIAHLGALTVGVLLERSLLSFRGLPWAVAEGLIAGALAAGFIHWRKPESREVGPAPARSTGLASPAVRRPPLGVRGA
jgi:hypothetical protein